MALRGGRAAEHAQCSGRCQPGARDDVPAKTGHADPNDWIEVRLVSHTCCFIGGLGFTQSSIHECFV